MSFYKIRLSIILFFFTTLFLAGCEEPYTPEVLERPNNYLVVSGFINSNGPTTIQLSRTQNLSAESKPALEKNAMVTVEGESGEKFQLLETEPGSYTSGNLLIDPTKKYRLFIRASGKEYASDYIEVKQTPAIDNIRWVAEPDGLQFYVNAQDEQNNTRYYRYEFEETWEYTAPHFSSFEYIDGVIKERSTENLIYLCYRNDFSKTILLANTTKLSQDVVSDFPIIRLPANSEKLKRKYSLLVKQFAHTRESFNYYEALKKNTESIGTLFDPLPTQLTGNITCLTSPSEPVLGYVTVSSVEEKRIFVSNNELPNDWIPTSRYCPVDTATYARVAEFFAGGSNIPIDLAFNQQGQVIGYLSSNRSCVDCRVFGTLEKPDFWQ